MAVHRGDQLNGDAAQSTAAVPSPLVGPDTTLEGAPTGTPAGTPAGTPVGALARLRQCLDALAGSTRRVGEFVLANPWEVRGLPISDLAAHVGVSVNTVNRLTRALGYRGYREFMQALALDLGKILGSAYSVPVVGTPPTGENGKPDVLGVVMNTLQVEQQSLQETMRHLDGRAIVQAVNVLAGAQTVLLLGTGSGVPVCAAAAYRLTFLGIRAVACSDPATAIAELHLLRPGDVVFAISHHGAAHQIIYALQRARQRGLTTLCLTAAARSPAAQAADVTLLSFGYEASGISGQFASRVVGAALVEALVAAVAWHKYGGVPPRVEDVLRDQQAMNLEAQTRRSRHKGGVQ
jgi:DNA-binding MurR/RpiR family transcriptional regulator